MTDISKALEDAKVMIALPETHRCKLLALSFGKEVSVDPVNMSQTLIEQQATLERYKAALEKCEYHATDFAIDDKMAVELIIQITNEALAGSK